MAQAQYKPSFPLRIPTALFRFHSSIADISGTDQRSSQDVLEILLVAGVRIGIVSVLDLALVP